MPGSAQPTGAFIVWITGLPAAGKTTLARALSRRIAATQACEVLDGDDIRAMLWPDLGFSREDRDLNIRRIAFLARLLARNGVAAIASVVSPYAAARHDARRLANQEGLPFVEVYVSASIETLVARDIKGRYRYAIAGDLEHFTGVSDPYEPPTTPEVVVQSDTATVEESVEHVHSFLRRNGLTCANPDPTDAASNRG